MFVAQCKLQLQGGKGISCMIDDSSRYTEVYLLGQKSEVPEKIKEYVRHVQTKFGKTPKMIRSDRGGEYTAERLQTFLKDEGIQAELTTPYTPQPNGCAERKNRSLVEMTRCMLNDSGLPKKFWGEAIMTAKTIYRTHYQSMEKRQLHTKDGIKENQT